jgi:hypothetical protein
MAADVSGKLVDKFDNLHRLHDSKRERAIAPTHGKFRRATKSRANRNTTGARLRLLKVLLT